MSQANICQNKKWVPCKDRRYCLPEKWFCDGLKDCKDGSDEQNCFSLFGKPNKKNKAKTKASHAKFNYGKIYIGRRPQVETSNNLQPSKLQRPRNATRKSTTTSTTSKAATSTTTISNNDILNYLKMYIGIRPQIETSNKPQPLKLQRPRKSSTKSTTTTSTTTASSTTTISNDANLNYRKIYFRRRPQVKAGDEFHVLEFKSSTPKFNFTSAKSL